MEEEHPMTRSRTWLGLVCAVAVSLGVFALGTPAASAKTTKPTVKLASVSGVGTVLVASDGHTLYTLTNNGQPVACTGACAALWPPLMVKSTKAKGAKGVTGLSVLAGHVSHDGLPLYKYAGDSKAGTASGEGITNFGGTWHVVKTSSGGGASTPANSTPAKSSSSSGYGY
jgi:predicted lipoprotein with Yx(FWY)xxD motif